MCINADDLLERNVRKEANAIPESPVGKEDPRAQKDQGLFVSLRSKLCNISWINSFMWVVISGNDYHKIVTLVERKLIQEW